MGIIAALMREWKLTLLAMATALFLAQSMRLQVVTAQRELAIQDLQNYKQAAEAAATTAKAQSDHALKETKREYEIQKAAVEKAAWANAKARFGSCNVAGGIRLDGLLTRDQIRDGETGSAGTADATAEESVAVGRSFIEACATDSSTILLWQRWATLNELKVSEQ